MLKLLRHTPTLFLLLILAIISFVNPSDAYEIGDYDEQNYNSPMLLVQADFLSSYDEDESFEIDETIQIYDPWEKYNRGMFKFNDKVFNGVLEPFSKGYDFVVPQKVQGSIDKFFLNIRTPGRLINCILQGKFQGAATELGRLLINTTVGVGGLFDPAESSFGLEMQDEDFGQTLGAWGMEKGRYIVWPIVGPSSTRDTLGFAGDLALNPLFWLGVLDVDPKDAWFPIGAFGQVNTFSYRTRDNYKSIRRSALDPYTSIQHAYIENRKKRIDE